MIYLAHNSTKSTSTQLYLLLWSTAQHDFQRTAGQNHLAHSFNDLEHLNYIFSNNNIYYFH